MQVEIEKSSIELTVTHSTILSSFRAVWLFEGPIDLGTTCALPQCIRLSRLVNYITRNQGLLVLFDSIKHDSPHNIQTHTHTHTHTVALPNILPSDLSFNFPCSAQPCDLSFSPSHSDSHFLCNKYPSH